ncbi:hypothetical protein BZL29_5438 [Mycobacterium kansasii]|uniref:Uncharacterized protein n=1 Tax=Mycobacterium kansasii TaxID=1768 RepID=A0A1V3WVV9_MYCKA|nr:hypothetical protein BZL29_5438 [Mycobacterium kansasii]
MLIGPANSARPPNWRNWRSQLRTSGPISSTRSAVGRNDMLRIDLAAAQLPDQQHRQQA